MKIKSSSLPLYQACRDNNNIISQISIKGPVKDLTRAGGFECRSGNEKNIGSKVGDGVPPENRKAMA